MPIGGTLKNLACAVANNAVRRSGASRAMEPLRPAIGLKRLLVLRFGSIVFDKFWHRQPRLKLDSVRSHNRLRLVDGDHIMAQQAHQMSLAGVCC
jgi:hypothetical protein